MRNGKEESYERNPGRVPLVFNHKFFEGSKNLLSVSKNLFDTLSGAPRTERPRGSTFSSQQFPGHFQKQQAQYHENHLPYLAAAAPDGVSGAAPVAGHTADHRRHRQLPVDLAAGNPYQG